MSLGDELRAEVKDILFDINSQITALAGVIDSAERAGEALLALHSHNPNVMIPGGTLVNRVPDEIKRIIADYRTIVLSLEDYIIGR